MQPSPSSRSWNDWVDLLLISAGLILSRVAYRIFFPTKYSQLSTAELLEGFIVSLICFYAAIKLSGARSLPDKRSSLFEQFGIGTGLTLIVHALLNYFDLLTRSFFLILVGAFFASCLLGMDRIFHRSSGAAEKGVLIIGFHPAARDLLRALGVPVLGMIGDPGGEVPAGVPYLGGLSDFEKVSGRIRPSHVIMASASSTLSPTALLKLRLAGVDVSDIPALYERQLERVYCRDLRAAEMLLSPFLYADSRTLAVQAVYTNLIGLFFLMFLFPFLFLGAAVVFLFGGPGPVIESVECVGFQKVPYRLLRFRTRRSDGSGDLSAVGKLLTRFHLVNLPRLINVMRGEIGLFGPRPVRKEFAQRLSEMMPFYSIRFFVKPGILGNGQSHLESNRLVSALTEIEYDLYYVKEASARLDMEIFIRALARSRQVGAASPELAGAL